MYEIRRVQRRRQKSWLALFIQGPMWRDPVVLYKRNGDIDIYDNRMHFSKVHPTMIVTGEEINALEFLLLAGQDPIKIYEKAVSKEKK